MDTISELPAEGIYSLWSGYGTRSYKTDFLLNRTGLFNIRERKMKYQSKLIWKMLLLKKRLFYFGLSDQFLDKE